MTNKTNKTLSLITQVVLQLHTLERLDAAMKGLLSAQVAMDHAKRDTICEICETVVSNLAHLDGEQLDELMTDFDAILNKIVSFRAGKGRN